MDRQKHVVGHGKRLAIALVGLALLFSSLGADVFHQISKKNTGAFETYIYAASAIRAGKNPYACNLITYYYVYPPFFAFVCQPLTKFSNPTAARIMLVVDTCFIVAALLLAAHGALSRFRLKTDLASVLGVALTAAIIVVVPIHNEMRGMETNSIVLLSFVLALYWLDRHPILSGLALAVAINIKYLPIIAIPYLLLRRRWLAAAATAGWSIALALLPALSIGWSTNLGYLQYSTGGLLRLAGMKSATAVARVQGTDVATSISITSSLSRLIAREGWPHIAAPALVVMVLIIWVMVLLLGYRRRLPVLHWPQARAQRTAPFDALLAIEWAGIVTFALAFSPNTQNRNLVLAVVPATLAAILLWFPIAGRSRRWIAFAVGMMLLGLILPIAWMGKPFTVFWLRGAWPCWCLLVPYVILHRRGLARVEQDAKTKLVSPDAPVPGVQAPHRALPHVA